MIWNDVFDEKTKVVLTYLACFFVGVYYYYYLATTRTKNNDDSASSSCTIPIAPNNIPILGHALSYKSDPCHFLRYAYRTCGYSPIFRINLCGNRMVCIVGSSNDADTAENSLIKQISFLPESILSARQAVAEIGFEYTLGKVNVYNGTDFHKRVLKDYIWKRDGTNIFVNQTMSSLRNALDVQLHRLDNKKKKNDNDNDETVDGRQKPQRIYVPDLFQLTRRTVLHAMISVLVGTCLLDDDTILEQMMDLEDQIEDATAKAAVLPKWLAVPFVLKPVQYQREQLQKKIALQIEKERMQRITNKHLGIVNDEKRWGPWLRAMMMEEGEEAGERRNERMAAELCVGLLFAAHKNPAIASAQSFCMLREYSAKDSNNKNWYRACIDEAKLMMTAKDNNDGEKPSSVLTVDKIEMNAPHLRHSIRETLRLCAHSIGAIRTTCQPITVSVADVTADASTSNSAAVTGCTADADASLMANHQSESKTKTTSVKTHRIQKGETIAILHNVTNTDARKYGRDALEYKPNRFFTNGDDATNASQTPPPPYATFSHGVHKCPGERVAMIMIQMLVALLLTKNANIENNGDSDSNDKSVLPPLSFERATLAQRKGPVAITIDV